MDSAPPIDDGALAHRLRAGDGEAYEAFVRAHIEPMLAVARRILRHEEDARDAVQEAFISAFKAVAGFDGRSRLSTWLHRIVVNAALQRLRSRNRKPEQSIEDLLPHFGLDEHQEPSPAAWREGPPSELHRKELRELVRHQIDRLPETYRVVLVLRDLEGYDTEETARLLGASCAVVKTRLHRARQALRTLLDPHMREELVG
jgi:RNA polymerase sigma-70 factor (ECF subfamily)